MSESMDARREAALELLALAGRMTKAAALIMRYSAILQDEQKLTGHGIGPLRKSITSTQPKHGWGKEVLAIIDKLEGVDPGGAHRATTREKLRDRTARNLAEIEAAQAGRLVPFHAFNRLRRDRAEHDGDHPSPGAA